jgi:hypothetical protein
MNSITFVVDKLTPPSAPLQPHHHPASSSPAVDDRPNSGYFSIYSSDCNDSDNANAPELMLRCRDKPLEPSSVFDDRVRLPEHILPRENFAIRWLWRIFSVLIRLLWTLLYPFSQTHFFPRRFFYVRLPPRHLRSSSLPSSVVVPPTSSSIAIPESISMRPLSSTLSTSEASSSATDSDTETDISTLAPTDTSEALSISCVLRHSPHLRGPSEKEELLALARRRTADSLKSPNSPRCLPSVLKLD